MMCGISAVYNSPNAIEQSIRIQLEQSSRGSDASGVAYLEGNDLKCFKKAVNVNSFYSIIPKSKSKIAIAHIRAATTNIAEKDKDKEAHPFLAEKNEFALIHNGHLIGYESHRTFLRNILGHVFTSGVDSEVFVHTLEELLARSRNRKEAMVKLLSALNTGNLLILFKDGELYGIPTDSSFKIALINNSVAIASESGGLLAIIKKHLDKNPKIRLWSPERDFRNTALVRIYLDKEERVVLDFFGDWKEAEVYKTWIPNRQIKCDFCGTYTLCEKVWIKEKKSTIPYDRCLSCYKNKKTVVKKYAPVSPARKRGGGLTVISEDKWGTKAKCYTCMNLKKFLTEIVYCPDCGELYCLECFRNKTLHDCEIDTKKVIDKFFFPGGGYPI